MAHVPPGLVKARDAAEIVFHRQGDAHLLMGLDPRQVDEQVAVQSGHGQRGLQPAGQISAHRLVELDHLCPQAGEFVDGTDLCQHRPRRTERGRVAHLHPGPLVDEPAGRGSEQAAVGAGQLTVAGGDQVGLEQHPGRAQRTAGRAGGEQTVHGPVERWLRIGGLRQEGDTGAVEKHDKKNRPDPPMGSGRKRREEMKKYFH